MLAEPLVSVIVAVRDGERYLVEALDSVIGQTHRELEVIVVDDGSSDGSLALARGFQSPVTCVAQAPAGAAAARNQGVERSRGGYLAFLDVDDVWEPRKLERQLAGFAGDPAADLVFGHLREFRSPELDPSLSAQIKCTPGPQPGRLPGTLLAKRKAWDRVGPLDMRWVVGEFMDWLLRARAVGLRERMLDDVVLRRRLHPASHGTRNRARRGDYSRILKDSLDRRRKDAFP